jgi:hypothetical protein
LVSRYQLLCPGHLAGSVVATTSRSRRSGPQPPSWASAAHQVSVWPSRKRRVTRRHRPGRFGPRQPSSPAASTGVWAASAGAQVPLRGLRASTNGMSAAVRAWVKPGVVAVEAVGHHHPEPDAGVAGGPHQLHRQLRLGLEPGIPLATGESRRRCVGHRMHRPIAALIGPQAGHGHDAVVDLAHRAQVLAGHMRSSGAVLAVAGVIQHQRALGMWSGGQVLTKQAHAALVDLLVVPGRLRQEPLQPLDFAVLGAADRLGAGQPGQGLVAVAWQQQALQVVAEAAALGQAREEQVEPLGVGLQRARCGWAGTAAGHRRRWAPGGARAWTGPPKPTPRSTNYR